MIHTILFACETPLSLKDFRAQLLAADQTAEARTVSYSGLYVNQPLVSNSQGASSIATSSGLLPTPFMSLSQAALFGATTDAHVSSSGSRSYTFNNSGRGHCHGGRNASFHGGRNASSFHGGKKSIQKSVYILSVFLLRLLSPIFVARFWI